MKHELLTTGYAGHDSASFLTKLGEHGVGVVVDVRRNPVSRKKGFSKTKLSQALSEADLKYVHLRDLGVPNPLRSQLRAGDISLPDYLLEFDRYVATQDDALDRLYELATNHRCCLLCVEHHPEECHRSVVATAVAKRNGCNLEVIHI